MADTVITTVVNTPSDQIVTKSGTNSMTGVNKFGSTSNYTQLGTDGTLTQVGNATTFDDIVFEMLPSRLGAGITKPDWDSTNKGFLFPQNDTSEYVEIMVQIPHKYLAGSTVYPHIHWFQTENNTPNFLIRYRWQKNGGTKTTGWTDYKCTTNAFTYVSGTLNQLSYGAGISAPVGYSISDILQIRLFRDTNNTSTVFSGADPFTTTVGVMSMDVHIEVDTFGSRTEYTK